MKIRKGVQTRCEAASATGLLVTVPPAPCHPEDVRRSDPGGGDGILHGAGSILAPSYSSSWINQR